MRGVYGLGAGDEDVVVVSVVVSVPPAGDAAVVVFVVVLLWVWLSAAGEGLTIVVLFSVLVPGEAAVVVG